MSSCNTEPIKLDSSPIITGGCAIKRSCNGSTSILSLYAMFSTGCVVKESCNAVEGFVRFP